MRFLTSLLPRRGPAVEPERDTETKELERDTEVKLLLADYYTALANSGGGLHDASRPWPIERAMREGYERVVWCFKAVSCIGENVGRQDIPFEVVEGPEDDERVVEDHPLSRLLNGIANPLETGEIFLERLSAQLLLSKRGVYVEVVKSNAGTPIRLDLLPPGRTRIVPGYEALIDHYEVQRLDGTRYDIEPERVRWIRKPHPIDPYSGVTPLEAAGLSLEMDYFARLYTVSFMRNDGRPATIVGISGPEKGGGGLNPTDMQALDARFGRGPTEAGKVTIVEGDVSVADLAKNPRDSNYPTASASSKVELLASFGVPESVLGNSSGRTWDNASQEDYTFWSVTMTGHLSRIAAGFLADVDEGQRPRFNLKKVRALEHPERERRKEMREEFDKGLRSAKSYADAAGYGDQVEDLPHTRALWMPAGRNPLPARESDAEALGMGTPVEGPPDAGSSDDALPGVPAGEGGEPGGALGAGAAPGKPLAVAAERVDKPTPSQAQPAQAAQSAPANGNDGGEAKAAGPVERKAAAAWEDLEPADTETAAQAALAAALTALVTRWMERAGTRLRSPKARKGTRHFTPEHKVDTRVGTKALDAAHAANEDDWQSDTEEAARPLIEQAAVAAAAAWLTAATGEAVTPGTLPAGVASAATTAAAAAMPALLAGAAWQARHAARVIADVDAAGGSVDDAVAAVRDRADTIREWAQLAASDAAGSAVEAAYATAAGHWVKVSKNVEVQRQWFSVKDERVRDTHRTAHGQTRGLDALFKVGSALLRYPRDPLGPPGEVRNCRCRSAYRHRRTGRFVRVTTERVS